MLIKYRLLNNPEDADWKEYDIVTVLRLPGFISRSQEEFDAMELARFQKYSDDRRLEFEVIS